jgi:hypothetical protein
VASVRAPGDERMIIVEVFARDGAPRGPFTSSHRDRLRDVRVLSVARGRPAAQGALLESGKVMIENLTGDQSIPARLRHFRGALLQEH